ncbi:MAG: hypothetical protein JXB00_14150 [Bacteroidales bacterium]|nr:hypothetical protein [Bacteroidales bacterium]
MDLITLHQNLLEAYSSKNLNNISLTLLNLYKSEQYETLQRIADIIGDFITIEIDKEGKGFSKLMMLYHPDRMDFHLNEINRLAALGDFDGLLGHAHILKLEKIEEIASAIESYEDIDYSPVYEWDPDQEGFHIEDTNLFEPRTDVKNRRRHQELTFYDAVKLREYGHTNTDYPTYYLEDWEEFEMTASEITDLEGIQYCIHAKIFDLSENYISDLAPLEQLTAIEELNLADNRIGFIDSLAFLKNLRVVILNNNRIDDISPLFLLSKLEYAELSGNKIHSSQIQKLRAAGVEVVY